jgi:pimeloyl-ACP methyl ester carboxylesterase
MLPGEIKVERRKLHGHEVAFRRGGTGSAILFIHGIASSYDTFDPVLASMVDKHEVVAPDLLGHGRSAKPRGDYSLGAYASGLRDLLEVLEIPAATVVGHSMGGGIAMQFAYQFPERCQRLVLVASGGLGPQVTPLLRAATLPGADLVLGLATNARTKRVLNSALSPFRRLGLTVTPSNAHIANHVAHLEDRDTRKAFLLTARSVLDLKGQRVDARDRLYLARAIPTMIIWGARDRFIPVEHGQAAHEMIPGSRLEIFDEAGHFPHWQDPERFSRCLIDFVGSTKPAAASPELL